MERLALQEHVLTPSASVFSSELPRALRLDAEQLRELWALHPKHPPVVRVGGREVEAPRWHRAFGHAYAHAGFVAEPTPLPGLLAPLLAWARGAVDARLNGLLVNWYDGALEHRIAPHKDTPEGSVPGCPIVTVSFGATRAFQMIVRKRRVELEVRDGSVVVIPYETNLRFAHAVPHRAGDTGRRVSVTLRGFTGGG